MSTPRARRSFGELRYMWQLLVAGALVLAYYYETYGGPDDEELEQLAGALDDDIDDVADDPAYADL